MGKKKKAKPIEKKKMSRAEIQYRAGLRKLAKLLRKRERLLDRLHATVLDESILEWETATTIERFLREQK